MRLAASLSEEGLLSDVLLTGLSSAEDLPSVVLLTGLSSDVLLTGLSSEAFRLTLLSSEDALFSVVLFMFPSSEDTLRSPVVFLSSRSFLIRSLASSLMEG